MKRKAILHQVLTSVLAVVGAGLTSQIAPAANDVPKEVARYVNDSKRHGMAEAEIRRTALAKGWSAALVDQAIAAGERNNSVSPSSSVRKSEASGSVPRTLPGSGSAAAIPDEYQIGAGDTLQISVWKEPDVTVPTVVVRPDGKITVPLIKEVEVAGLTPRQAEERITDGLSKFIADANVTVVVSASNSKKVYIIGAVKKEGTLPYTYGITVMQALSEMGGLTEYAKRKKIYVLRTENGRDYRLNFNYDEVVRGERMEQNIVLLPGDTVVVAH
jgi:polysaccharide export outer membrane protein